MHEVNRRVCPRGSPIDRLQPPKKKFDSFPSSDSSAGAKMSRRSPHPRFRCGERWEGKTEGPGNTAPVPAPEARRHQSPLHGLQRACEATRTALLDGLAHKATTRSARLQCSPAAQPCMPAQLRQKPSAPTYNRTGVSAATSTGKAAQLPRCLAVWCICCSSSGRTKEQQTQPDHATTHACFGRAGSRECSKDEDSTLGKRAKHDR